MSVAEAITQLDNLALAVAESLQNLIKLATQILNLRLLRRVARTFVGEKIPVMAVVAIPDGTIKTDRIAIHEHDLLCEIERGACCGGGFFNRRFASVLLNQFSRGVSNLLHRLDHMDGNTNRARLVGDGARDRLTNPPSGVGAEFEPATIFELVDGAHQPRVSFLNEIEEVQTAVAIFLGDGDDEAQVSFRETLLRLLVFGVNKARGLNATAQARGSLLRHLKDVAELHDLDVTFLRGTSLLTAASDLLLKIIDALAITIEGIEDAVKSFLREPHFLDKTHGATAAAREVLPRLNASFKGLRLAHRDAVVASIANKHGMKGAEIFAESRFHERIALRFFTLLRIVGTRLKTGGALLKRLLIRVIEEAIRHLHDVITL